MDRDQNSNFGQNVTIITVVDQKFLPGAWALYNSARENGFKGRFLISHHQDLPSGVALPAPDLQYRKTIDPGQLLHPFIKRIAALIELEPGDYIYMDGDIVVERPFEIVTDAIGEGMVVSTEDHQRFDPNDIWIREQGKRAGITTFGLPPHPYVNSGFLAFQIPRDLPFLKRLFTICDGIFKGVKEMHEDTIFPFLDQDVLNLLVRERIRDGGTVFSISPKRIDFGGGNEAYLNRPFPHSRQGDLRPKDILKLIIHGTAMRRPWLEATRPGWKGKAEAMGVLPWRRKLKHRITAYERAWAYYACAPNMPIAVESWTEAYGFSAHKNPLWRMAYGLNS